MSLRRAITPLLVAPLALTIGCPGEVIIDDLPPAEPAGVLVADGLRFSEPTRYAVQKKLVALADGTLLAAFHDGVADQPMYLRPVMTSTSADDGASWTEPVQVTPADFTHIEFAALGTDGQRVVLVFTGMRDPMTATAIFAMEGQADGGQIAWAAPEEITPQADLVEFKFPSVVIDPAGNVHVLCRADAPYDAACDELDEECGHELRHVFYLTDESGEWTVEPISARWTSTVPELDLDPAGGVEGPTGRGRLWAVWHNEERETVPIGCMVADVSLWSRDLDSGEATLSAVPGSWQGEDCDAEIKSALLPSISVDAAGLPHVLWNHADADHDLIPYHARALDDGSWSEPQPVTGEELRISAVLTLPGDHPVVYSTRGIDGAGEVIAFELLDGAWSEHVLHRSDTSELNWANPSLRPVTSDCRHGVLFGRTTDVEFAGAVYFVPGP